MGDVLKNSVKVVDFYEINFFAISEIAIFFFITKWNLLSKNVDLIRLINGTDTVSNNENSQLN